MVSIDTINLGDTLTTAPEGYTRYTQDNSLVYFDGMSQIRQWGRFGTLTTSSITIYTKNIKDIFFTNLTDSSCGVQNVYINDELIEDKYYSCFNKTPETSGFSNKYDTVNCKLHLTKNVNKIEIKNDWLYNSQVNFISVIFPTNEGSLMTQEEYDKTMRFNFLIKNDDGYIGYKNGSLVNVSDYVSAFENKDDCLMNDNFEEVLPLIDFRKNPKIVTQVETSFKVEGIKTNDELLVSKHLKSLIFADEINSITVEGNSTVKCAFSIDEGVTWLSYDGENVFELLHTYHKKPVNGELTQTQLNENESLRYDILNYGFDISTLDFNPYKNNTLEFAFVLSNYDTIKGINITYKADDSYKVLGDNDITIEKVLGKYIKLEPHREINSAILEILTTGFIDSADE